MIISCPSCSTRYDVPETALGPQGRTVKCAQCGNRWLAKAGDPQSGAEPRDFDDVDFDVIDADTSSPDGAAPAFDDSDIDVVEENFEDLEAPTIDVEAAPRGAPIDRRVIVKRPSRKPLPWSKIAAAAACLGLVYAASAYRVPIVKAVPQLASAYGLVGIDVNVRGLTFADLSFRFGAENGARMLVVTGAVENVTEDVVAMPDMRLTLRDAAGTALLSWNRPLPVALLPAGGSTPFTVKLANPPETAESVTMRFVEREQAALPAENRIE